MEPAPPPAEEPDAGEPAPPAEAPDSGEPTPPAEGGIDLEASTVTLDRAAGVVADGVDTATVTVTLLDTQGGFVSDAPVALEVSGTGNALAASVRTDEKGVARLTLRSTVAETKTLGVLVGETPVQLGEPLTVRFVAGAASALGFVVEPGTARAGEAFEPAVQVGVVDAHGNVVTEGTASVSLTLTSSNEAVLAGTTTASMVGGFATFSDLSIAKAGTGYTFTASAEGLTSATSVPFTVTAGAPSRLAFTSSPADLIAGEAFSPSITVEAYDVHENPVSGVLVTLALAENTTSGVLLGTTQATTTEGVATFSALRVERAGEYTLAATATGFAGAESTAFAVQAAAPDASQTTLTVGTAKVSVDGEAVAPFTFAARDAFGNAIAELPVSFTVSPADGTLSITSGVTNNAGELAVSLTSTVAGAKTVTASFGALTRTASVTFEPGAPSQTQSTFERTNAGTRLADGLDQAVFALTLRDAFGNTIPDAPVTASTDLADALFEPHSGATNATGIFELALTSTTGGTATVTVTLGALSWTASAAFAAPRSVSGEVSGIGATEELELALNQGAVEVERVVLTADGGFSFTQRLPEGAAYAVSVTSSPAAKVCSLENGSGTLGAADVTGIRVACLSKWLMVSAGSNHVLGIKADGTLWAWGWNSSGQVGDGTTLNRNVPVQVGTDTWVFVSAQVNQSFGIKSDGTLWAWGYNGQGQLGDGTTTSRSAPVQVGTDDDWESVSAQQPHVLAVKRNGTLWAWGENTAGQLGDGTTTNRSTPAQVGTDSDWARVNAGSSQTSMAIKADGRLFSWGAAGMAGSFLLGFESAENQLTPVEVAPGTTWATVTTGGVHALARAPNGTLWTWGINQNNTGQLGFNSSGPSSQTAPRQLGAGSWASATAGGSSSYAVTTAGALWAWGANSSGQLGDGTTTARYQPVRIGTASDWASVSTSSSAAFGIKTDGTLWSWGAGAGGELGAGLLASRSTPGRVLER